MDRWRQFAATQRLLMALRLSKVYPGAGDFAAQELNAAVTAGPVGPGETLRYEFLPTDPNNYNPFYNNYTVANRNAYAISKTMVDIMTKQGAITDPRLPVYGEVQIFGVCTRIRKQ